jgi:hypothetical protein
LRLVLEIIKAFGLNHSGRSPDLLAPYLGSFDRSTVTGQLAPYFPQRLSAVVLQIEAPKGSLVSRNPQRLLFEFSGGGSAAPPTHRLKMANQLHAGSDHRRRQHLTPGHRELWNQRHLFADRNRDRQGRRHAANLCLGVLRHPNTMDALRKQYSRPSLMM